MASVTVYFLGLVAIFCQVHGHCPYSQAHQQPPCPYRQAAIHAAAQPAPACPYSQTGAAHVVTVDSARVPQSPPVNVQCPCAEARRITVQAGHIGRPNVRVIAPPKPQPLTIRCPNHGGQNVVVRGCLDPRPIVNVDYGHHGHPCTRCGTSPCSCHHVHHRSHSCTRCGTSPCSCHTHQHHAHSCTRCGTSPCTCRH